MFVFWVYNRRYFLAGAPQHPVYFGFETFLLFSWPFSGFGGLHLLHMKASMNECFVSVLELPTLL